MLYLNVHNLNFLFRVLNFTVRDSFVCLSDSFNNLIYHAIWTRLIFFWRVSVTKKNLKLQKDIFIAVWKIWFQMLEIQIDWIFLFYPPFYHGEKLSSSAFCNCDFSPFFRFFPPLVRFHPHLRGLFRLPLTQRKILTPCCLILLYIYQFPIKYMILFFRNIYVYRLPPLWFNGIKYHYLCVFKLNKSNYFTNK